jgi:hypothetical protein
LVVAVKVKEFEVPPPGAGLVTVTAGVPVEAMLAAGMAAVNRVELKKVVAAADPPKFTVEDATKFVPPTKSVKAAQPAAVPFGEIKVIAGVRFAGGGGGGGGGGDCCVELFPPQLARPDTANNKKIAHIVRERPLPFI